MRKRRDSQGFLQRKLVDGESVPVGNLTIDKVLLGIRIKRSIGSKSKIVYNKVYAFLCELKDKRDTLTIQAIKDHPDIPLDEIIRWYYSQDTIPKPWGEGTKILFPAMRSWVESETKIRDRTKHTYRWNISRLQTFAENDHLRVNDLPSLLTSFRESIPEHKVLFNRIRATCLSFLNSLTGTSHQTYKETVAVRGWRKKDIERKREGRHLTPVEIDNAFIDEPNHPMRSLVYFLCTTGIRPEEFCRHGFEIRKDKVSIRIKGQKTASSDRIVPLIFLDYDKDNSHFGFTHDSLNNEIKKWLPNYTTQDCRRTYHYWAQQAGWEMNRLRYYYGHEKTMTDVYGQQNAERYWVKEDSKKMSDWLREQRIRLPEPDPGLISIPRTIDDLELSTANLKKKDIIDHLNHYLESNHPGVFRRLYRVTQLTMVREEPD